MDKFRGIIMNKLIKKFPAYFQNFVLPDGAVELELEVYRACKSNCVDKESFTPTFEELEYNKLSENQLKEVLSNRSMKINDPSLYALSTFEKPKDVKRFAITNSACRPPMRIAKGITSTKCGLTQRTKERTRKRTSHVDWWLYSESNPHEYFELIDDFEKYLDVYRTNVR